MSVDQQYLAAEIALWLQQECGDAWTFLGCHNLTGVSVPRGDTNPIYCRTGKNKFTVQRTWRGTPGLGALTIVAYDTVLNYIQEQPCAFNLVALHSAAGSDDDPLNYDYLYYYNGVEVTSVDTDTHVIGQNPDDQAPVMLSMPGTFQERIKVKDLSDKDVDVSALTTVDLNAVTVCDEPSCDAFGNLDTLGCQQIFASSDGPTAVILKSVDGGSTFTSISTPFSVATSAIVDVQCDGATVIAVNGVATEYAYSWDAGVTWTVVTTPARLINQVYMLGSTQIWFVCQDGYIYYSANRGGSVTLQDAGSATTQSLNDISASSSLLLYAVGDNNAFVRTEDGGTIWSAVTGPATGAVNDDLYKVLAIPGTDIVFIGDEEGNVYRSPDKGATWTTVLAGQTSTAGGVRGLVACDCNIVLVAANDQDPYFYGASGTGVVFQSVDGGNSWTGVEVPTNTGILDMVCCDVNRYWLVGVGGFIAQLAGPTLTT